jgi:hypothetical protein
MYQILVDGHLHGHYRLWANVAAFGDNIGPSAHALAKDTGLTEPEIKKRSCLDEYLNYNSYGDRMHDLHSTRPVCMRKCGRI